MAQAITLYHHERYDGLGYWHVSKEQQPIYVRIVTVVDVFTALITKRVYKDAWTVKQAAQYLKENTGSQFDPVLVRLFLPIIQRYDFSR